MRIIPRDRWIDFKPAGRAPTTHRGNPHVVHWFGPGKAAVGYTGSLAQAQSFARYHRFTHGWADIGYNWVILRDENPDGLATVLEGRGTDVRGAHAGHNVANGYAGVLLMCGAESPGPTPAQLNALIALTAREGWGKRTGHREWSSTICPGPVLWPWVQRNRFDAPQPITKDPAKAKWRKNILAKMRPLIARWKKAGSPEAPPRTDDPSDSKLYRVLLRAGFGRDSAIAIIKARRPWRGK